MPSGNSLYSGHRRPGGDTDATTTDAPEQVAPRLVVDLNSRAARALSSAVQREELNKTTIVNRALLMYEQVMEKQAAGGAMILQDPDGTAERYKFL